MKSLKEKFEEKILVTPGCWLWMASSGSAGYGQIGHEYKILQAHRVSYELYVAKLKEGECVCHKCDNPICVNPDHLFTGSHKDNAVDRSKKGRSASKLSKSQVIAILGDARGEVELSAIYGVCRTTINGIKNRKTWRHI